VRQVGLPAPVLECVSEAVGRVRFSILGDQKRQVLRWRRCDGIRQVTVQRDIHVDRIAVLVFRLAVTNSAVLDVLRS